jgi:hypothetical protein
VTNRENPDQGDSQGPWGFYDYYPDERIPFTYDELRVLSAILRGKRPVIGRPCVGDKPMTSTERSRRSRAKRFDATKGTPDGKPLKLPRTRLRRSSSFRSPPTSWRLRTRRPRRSIFRAPPSFARLWLRQSKLSRIPPKWVRSLPTASALISIGFGLCYLRG